MADEEESQSGGRLPWPSL
ncbi:hypothetical protein [Sicyoidochytrium minutum DNA virus]|nr:hypothetical protein [Sicyoidochytrium minutum DNA virus]